ncbi:hypothetical protein DMB42_52640 [Nonomuraea sp. WAC 01424]|nr:hypothetical protein DMB42_52640 [Nonomuraea sp. WAC 01424]
MLQQTVVCDFQCLIGGRCTDIQQYDVHDLNCTVICELGIGLCQRLADFTNLIDGGRFHL